MPLLLSLVTLVHIYFSLDEVASFSWNAWHQTAPPLNSSVSILIRELWLRGKFCSPNRCMGKGIWGDFAWMRPSIPFPTLTLWPSTVALITAWGCSVPPTPWQSEFYTQPTPKGVILNEPPYPEGAERFSCSWEPPAECTFKAFLFFFFFFEGVFFRMKENSYIST